jgi:hypothetical protein
VRIAPPFRLICKLKAAMNNAPVVPNM